LSKGQHGDICARIPDLRLTLSGETVQEMSRSVERLVVNSLWWFVDSGLIPTEPSCLSPFVQGERFVVYPVSVRDVELRKKLMHAWAPQERIKRRLDLERIKRDVEARRRKAASQTQPILDHGRCPFRHEFGAPCRWCL
jgi:hypothetical protein